MKIERGQIYWAMHHNAPTRVMACQQVKKDWHCLPEDEWEIRVYSLFNPLIILKPKELFTSKCELIASLR